MSYQTFSITSIIEGSTKSQDSDNVRLRCLNDKKEMVIFWGTYNSNTQNINLIAQANLPIKISCDCIPPEPWGQKYGHKWWIPEDSKIKFV